MCASIVVFEELFVLARRRGKWQRSSHAGGESERERRAHANDASRPSSPHHVADEIRLTELGPLVRDQARLTHFAILVVGVATLTPKSARRTSGRAGSRRLLIGEPFACAKGRLGDSAGERSTPVDARRGGFSSLTGLAPRKAGRAKLTEAV